MVNGCSFSRVRSGRVRSSVWEWGANPMPQPRQFGVRGQARQAKRDPALAGRGSAGQRLAANQSAVVAALCRRTPKDFACGSTALSSISGCQRAKSLRASCWHFVNGPCPERKPANPTLELNTPPNFSAHLQDHTAARGIYAASTSLQSEALWRSLTAQTVRSEAA
jgi:hypothetical protein